MITRDNVEVVGRAIVLALLGTSQEFLVVHDPEICSLDGVVGVDGVRYPMLVLVVSTPSYLNFISYTVALGGVASISWGVCWSISRWVGWSIGCSFSSGISRLHYFVFASPFFSHRVERTLATTSLSRTLRSASGIGARRRSAISRTSCFDLSNRNTDIGLEAPDRWRIFKVV
jgi:hypothetical protein